MRAGAVARRHRQMRRALAERAGLTVEEPRVGVEAVGERGGKARIEQRALGQHDLEQIVEAFVEQHRGIERHDHVDAEEQLAEALVDVEVDRALRLIVGAGPVEHRDLALAVDRQRHAERAVADAVVVDIIGEADRLLGNVFLDEHLHRLARARRAACRRRRDRRRGRSGRRSRARASRPSGSPRSAPSGRRGSCRACACC